MPTHVYQPLRNPPTWWDRLMVHPVDATVAALVYFMGLLSAVSVLLPSFVPSLSMEEMPLILRAVIAAFLILGGLFILIGLNWIGDEVSRGWAIERFGWLLAAGGLFTYGLSVLTTFPGSAFSWGVPLFIAVGSLLRFVSIIKIERNTRQVIAEVKGGTV